MKTQSEHIVSHSSKAQPGTRRFVSLDTLLARRRVYRHTKNRLGVLYRVAVEALSPAELEILADSVQRELQRLGHLAPPKPTSGTLIQAIDQQLEPLGFPKRQEDRERLLQDVLADSFQQRQALLADALTAPQVAALLHTSRQTPLNRADKGTLLAVYESGKWLFPHWQFDTCGPDGVVAGLPEVLHALDVSPIEKLSWLVRISVYLEGRSPLEALKAGEPERVVSLARAVGAA